MYVVFSDSNGRREGLVLAASEDRLRLAVAGSGDAIELECLHGRWTINGWEAVDVEFLMETGWNQSSAPVLCATA